MYDPGDAVMVSTEAADQGKNFQSWEIFSHHEDGTEVWNLLSEDLEVNLTMDSSKRIRALYGEIVDFKDGLPAELTGTWELDPTAGPTGTEAAWVSLPAGHYNPGMEWTSEAPVVTDFWVLVTGGTMTIRKDSGDWKHIEESEDWQRVILSHDPENPWRITFSGNSEEKEIRIHPVSVLAGSGVNLITHPGGQVDFPDGLATTAGSSIALTAIPDSGRKFVAWGNEPESATIASINPVAGSDDWYEAIFSTNFEVLGHTFKQDPRSEWGSSENDSKAAIGTVLDSLLPRWIEVPVSGPATIRYRRNFTRYYNDSTASIRFQVFLDGESILEEYATQENRESEIRTLDIPSGEHVLRFETETDDVVHHSSFTHGLQIENLTIDSGYRLDLMPSLGGTVIRVPDKITYEPDEVVTLYVQPEEDFEFFGWSGDFSGNDRAIEVTMDGPKQSELSFIGSQSRYGLQWTLWNTRGGEVNYNDEWWLSKGNPDLGPGWVETTLEGPGVLEVGRHYSFYDSTYSAWYVWMDGVLVPDAWRIKTGPNTGKTHRDETGPLQLTIPDGSHTIRIPLNTTRSTGLNNVSYYPGYKLLVNSPGGSVKIDPISEAYASRSFVNLESVPDPGVVEVEWPEFGQSGNGPFTAFMIEHKVINVRHWREILLDGHKIRYAGRDRLVDRISESALKIYHEPSDDPGLVEISVNGPCELSVSYSSHNNRFPEDYDVELFIDGISQGSQLIEESGMWSMNFESGEHVVRWAFHDASERMYLHSISVIHDNSNPYTDWLKSRLPTLTFRDLPADSQGLDLDGDNIALQLEYMLDLDPLNPECILMAEPWQPEAVLNPWIRLWYPHIPEAHLEDIVVEYTADPDGTWMPIDPFVMQAETVSDCGCIFWNQTDLSFDGESDDTLFFRLRYKEDNSE